MDDKLKANQLRWDELTARHVDGRAYPVDDFIAGKIGTKPNIPDDIGCVNGKDILHLQCHFGLDSMMWARLGANVTAIDFSPRAILEGRRLASKLGLKVNFIESEIGDLPTHLTGQFDIVITYFGVLTWLPDIYRWGEVAARYVKPGGFLYVADTHPIAGLIEPDNGEKPFRFARDYFAGSEAQRYEEECGSYANPEAANIHKVSYEWQHSLADIVNSLVRAKLRIEYLHEFQYTFYDMFYFDKSKHLVQSDDGWWYMPTNDKQLPLMFSIKAARQ